MKTLCEVQPKVDQVLQERKGIWFYKSTVCPAQTSSRTPQFPRFFVRSIAFYESSTLVS